MEVCPDNSGRQHAKQSLLHGKFRKNVILCPGLRDTGERNQCQENTVGGARKVNGKEEVWLKD